MNNVLNEASTSHRPWNNLSMQEKAAMIRVAVKNGLTDLKSIREKYNEFAEGGRKDDGWTLEDENKYQLWRASLPDNLKNTNDDTYDMRAAFKAGMQPVLNSDGYYHLDSRDPKSGRILKAPYHPTYIQAINTDARLGYYPTIDINGNTYTQTWKGNKFKGGGSKRRQESIHNNATQQAMQYFMGKGLTDYQAAGLVGNLFRESRLVPTATNAGSGAYGIAQWLGPRKKNLFAKYGKNPTFNQQLDYVWHELGNTHRTGLKAIKSSKNAEEAARNAMGYYEFSAGPEAAIREMRRWGQDGEGAMQKGINFASQLIGGPVVPFRAETPQWDNIPFTPANPEVFFGNPVTTSQPVVSIEPTKTPVLEYDPKEVERQEKRDNLNRFNMFLGMLNGSNESVNESVFPFSMFAEGGKIHISPSKRGTFTAAASRHNMGVQEFASKVLANKDDYSSAMVKKANFARNSSKWKHGLGGNLFEDGGNLFVKYVDSYRVNPDTREGQ